MHRLSPARIVVIGAGPAGLAAAERLSEAGRGPIMVVERMRTPGRKLLIAGRGGLNLTHCEPYAAFLSRYAEASSWLTPAIDAFPPEQMQAWAKGLGQEVFVGSSGRVFPRAMKASGLLRAWLARLQSRGVVLRANCTWEGWTDTGGWRFSDGLQIGDAAVLLALGGASWPRLGSDGRWATYLARRGVSVARLRPANCGMRIAWSEPFRERFAGRPLKNLTLQHGGTRSRGDLMLTRAGIEGGALYPLSAMLRDEVASAGRATLQIDLRPDQDHASLVARLSKPRRRESLSNALRKALALPPEAVHLLRESAGLAPPREPEALATLIKGVTLCIDGTDTLDRAISTAGGIRHEAIDGRFMLRALPGVFVAGEMLDWEAPTGGYLLQASIATGRAAAGGMLDWLDHRSPA